MPAPGPDRYYDSPDVGTSGVAAAAVRALIQPEVSVPEFLARAEALRLTGGMRSARLDGPGSTTLTPTRNRTPKTLARIVALIESAPSHQHPLRAKRLATLLQINQFYMGRVLRVHSGFSWHQWTRGAHMRATLQQLAESRGLIRDVAQSCNWSSHERMCREIRRFVGMSPRRFATLVRCTDAPRSDHAGLRSSTPSD